MSKYLDKARECRTKYAGKYNCAESVAVAFATEAGLSEDFVCQIASNFGGGMHMGSVCGAFSGGLIALGLFGLTGAAVTKEFTKIIKEKHNNTVICTELLKINQEAGGDKKNHCDEMIYDCTQAVEDILRANGKIQ